MPNGHSQPAEGHIEYGDAAVLFPVEELDASVLQYRDAQLALADADGADVLAVTPTSLATSYALAQRPLTAIRVDTLPAAVRTQLEDALDVPLDTFDLIQVGRWNADSENHSLAEFTA